MNVETDLVQTQSNEFQKVVSGRPSEEGLRKKKRKGEKKEDTPASALKINIGGNKRVMPTKQLISQKKDLERGRKEPERETDRCLPEKKSQLKQNPCHREKIWEEEKKGPNKDKQNRKDETPSHRDQERCTEKEREEKKASPRKQFDICEKKETGKVNGSQRNYRRARR